jgi:H-type lectin domain
MRLIPPQKGQPIDYQYISTLVNEVNNLASSKTLSKVKDVSTQTEAVQISAQSKTVVSNENITPGYVKDFVVEFKTSFKSPPVVTVTAQRSANTRNEASREVAVVIDNITTTSVTGKITFIGTSSGVATISLNVIAVGISSTQI